MFKNTLSSAVCAAALLLPGTVNAGADPDILEGFGEDIPLSFAVRQIVPSSRDVHYGPDIDVQATVSWEGGAPWPQILEEMASEEGLVVSIDDEEVRLRKPNKLRDGGYGFEMIPYQGSPVPPEEVDEPESATAQANSGTSETSEAEPVSEQNTGEASKWEVESGKQLSDVISSWGEASGWSLVYRTRYEFPIEASATFYGSFVEASSALLESLSRVKPQPKARFYKGNKVIVIYTAHDGIIE